MSRGITSPLMKDEYHGDTLSMSTCDICRDWNERARAHLHWLSVTHSAWLHHEHASNWAGWYIGTAASVVVAALHDWQPWSAVCDDSEAPYVRWFLNALTSAAFNELDRHVLQVCRSQARVYTEKQKLLLTVSPFATSVATETRARGGLLFRSTRCGTQRYRAARAATSIGDHRVGALLRSE